MVKKKRRTATASTRTQIIRTPAPIVRVTQAAPQRFARARRVASRVGGFGPSATTLSMGLAGVGVGFAVKSGFMDKLPAIPVIGRIGTAALLLDYWGKHGGGTMVKNAATGTAFLAGYQLGSEGQIHGDEEPQAPMIHTSYGDDGADDDDG